MYRRLWGAEGEVWSVKCEVQSVERRVRRWSGGDKRRSGKVEKWRVPRVWRARRGRRSAKYFWLAVSLQCLFFVFTAFV